MGYFFELFSITLPFFLQCKNDIIKPNQLTFSKFAVKILYHTIGLLN